MKLITGTGIAASALMIAGGTSAVALSQSASADTSPLGVQSSLTSTHDGAPDFDVTEIDHWKSEAAADDVEGDDTGDASQVQGTEPEDSTDVSGTSAALGQAHAAAMQAWAQCVAQAASGQKTMASQIPPKLACGEKPLPPGLAKKMTQQQTAPAPSTTTGSETESDVPDTHAYDSTDDSTTDGQHSWGHHSWGDHSSGDHNWSHEGSDHHSDGGDHAEGHDD